MRIAGTIELDGLYVTFNQGTSQQTTLQAGAPGSNITLNLPTTADTLAGIAASQTLTNKTINAANNTISNLTVAMLAAGVLNTSTSLTGATDSQVPSALAAKTYADNAASAGLAAKADKTTTISAGTGLTGGGDLSANRTIALADTAVTLGSYGSATQVATFTVDQQGRLTAAANTSIQIAQSQVTNLVTDLAGKQAADVDLDALAALSTAGLIARTGAGTAATRTITQPAAGITVTDGDGVAGNPTLALANDLAALEGLSSTGIAVRTASDTWAQRTITAGTGISVTDGNGVAGNPTVAIDSTVATLTGTQVFTNKDYDGGTASNSRRLTVPKDTYTNLLALTRKEGTLLYATDQDILYSDDGTNLNAVGSGSGSGTGSLNIVDNPSAVSSASAGGWTNGTSHTGSRDTTNSPLAGVIDTCFAIVASAATAESSTSGFYAASLAMPPALRNGKVQCNLWVTVPATADGVWRLSVYNSSGTRMSTDRDSSSVFTLPGGYTGQLPFTFDAADSATYTISFTQTTRTNANTLYATLISIGNGQIGSVPAVGNWQSYTPTFVSGPSTSTNNGRWRRVGSNMELEGYLVSSGAGAASTFAVLLPSGYTIDTSAMAGSAAAGANTRGTATLYDGTNFIDYLAYPYISGGNNGVRFLANNTAADLQGTGLASGRQLGFKVSFPIAEWAGSVSTGPVPAEEFAYNSDTTDASTTASGFAYGPGGVLFGSFSTANRTKRVRFQYPIQADDEICLELFDNTGNQWVPASSSLGVSLSATTGIVLQTVNTTDIDVIFGSAGYGNTVRAAASAWNGIAGFWKWRVRKTKKASLPFANASDTASGLLTYYKTETVTLSSSGASAISGTLRCTRVGNNVTINSETSGGLTHSSSGSLSSATGVIPAAYRPAQTVSVLFRTTSSTVNMVTINTDGSFSLLYRDWAGTPTSLTATGDNFAVSFNINA